MSDPAAELRRRWRRRGDGLASAVTQLGGGAPSVRAALLFAYFLYVAATGLFAGISLIGSLILSLVGLGLAIGSLALYITARDTLEDDLTGRILISSAGLAAFLFCGLVVIVPLVVVLTLGIYALVSVPLWLIRS